MKRRLHLLVLAALLALIGCGSDPSDPISEPEVTDPIYVYAGTGQGALGPMGLAPHETQLYWPQDVIFAPDGRPYVIDHNNHRVITVDDDGKFTMIAGGAFGEPCPGSSPPCEDIVANATRLNHPTHVAFDNAGNMVLCAWHNSELFLLDQATGLMDRFCGTSVRPCFGPVPDPQDALTACVDLPAAVAYDAEGGLCFTDQAHMIIRRIKDGTVDTIVGTQPVYNSGTGSWALQYGFSGDGGPANEARLSFPRGQIADVGGKFCFDADGNMYIADTSNHAIRRVDAITRIITRVAGAAPVSDGLGGFVGVEGYSGDGGPALSARLRDPRDVAVDADGNVYIADTGNHVIRRVRPDGTISTVVGAYRDTSTWVQPISPEQIRAEKGRSARTVLLTSPYGVEVDARNRLWVCDTENNVIRVLQL